MPDEGNGIFYSYQQILERIERKIDDLQAIQRGKLDQEVFLTFQSLYTTRHEELSKRVDVLEKIRAGNAAVLQYRKWVIGLALSCAGLILTFVGLLISDLLALH